MSDERFVHWLKVYLLDLSDGRVFGDEAGGEEFAHQQHCFTTLHVREEY